MFVTVSRYLIGLQSSIRYGYPTGPVFETASIVDSSANN
jgi:hypothetical protein